MSEELDRLATEATRPGLDDLDGLPATDLVRVLLDAERTAQQAIAAAGPRIAEAVAAVAERMERGGRLFYLGAGTPGRLAALDAAELAPTFSVQPGVVIPLIAGGPGAMTQAIEGAEDDPDAAARALAGHGLAAQDAVVGITASGRTPYVLGGLRCAREAGALAVAVVNNPGAPAAALAEIAIEVLTGAEVIAGSTRLTAGTAQKIVLNTLSTAVMVRLGKTCGPWMVDLQATNAKLRRRAVRIVCDITGAAEPEAAAVLAASGGRVKTAVVAILAKVGASEAERRLVRAKGRVRDALSSP